MILHIPHSSIDTLEKDFQCDLNLELDRMTDIDTDKLFDHPQATKIIFPISRLICDVERFEDDEMEEMAKKGMGVCYTTNSFGEPLRKVSEQERSEIIKKYYRPHHQALTEAVDMELLRNGTSLIIDCHSFSNIPLPHEDSQNTPRPDICIGTDDFHTPKDLLEKTVKYFESCGYTVAINSPFSGTLIPMEYYQKHNDVQGIMIEVNRDLYKDDFESVQKNISAWFRDDVLMTKRDKLRKWLSENVQVFSEPKTVTLSNFSINWDDFSGEFQLSLDSLVLSEKLIFGLESTGKITFYLPMFHSPLSVPASFAAIEITDRTRNAILKGLNDTLPRLRGAGIDTKTGKSIAWYTPPIERIEKSILEEAKAKVSKQYYRVIELKNL